jgi:predicted nucleic acid-binding protein
MKLALDTNRYTDFCRGESDVVEAISRAEQIFLPFVVLGELRAGFKSGTRARQNESNLTRFNADTDQRYLDRGVGGATRSVVARPR